QYILCLSTHARHRSEQPPFLRRARQLDYNIIFTSNDFGSYLRPHCHVGYQTLVLKKKSKPLDFQNEIAHTGDS
ncbi:hypothetical protein, partial [Pseudomonas viridiflava]|uniref:hypothetical protein n=1 Tax=Pseudomonas viridiflava TaxID=33069 RepID=UPI0019D15D37